MKRIRPEEANRALTANVLTTGEPGAPAQQFLYRLNLSERFAKDPVATIGVLHSGLGQADEADRLFALAELSFDCAERSGDRSYYLASAAYAWAFLVPVNPESRPSCFDPRLRTAMDLYNRGITSGLATGKGDEVDLNARTVSLPFGTLYLDDDRSGFTYGGYRLDHFTSLADFEVRGLRNRYRRRGIGAPLAAQVSKSGQERVDRWIGPRAKVPVTALVRFDNPRLAMSTGELHGTIQLFDAETSATVQIGDVTIPLESETTSTLAYALEGAPLWDFEIAGFRSGDFSLEAADNLLMLHPFHPGRIPVVFVHGTASSPARWAEMANELLGDPVLGKRYQLWFFLYNTGNPVAYSAMRLREALQRAVNDLDPEGKDPALHQMVIIGHSQGGLLTKMTAVSSGTRFWDNISTVPFEQADLDPEARDLIRRSLFVEPLPFVKEVIFIATPHRGSFLADNFLGNIARKLVSLPGNITKVGVSMVKLQAAGALKTAFTMPTSIDNMKGSNPFLKTLVALPIAPGVDAHSIIAVQGDGPPEKGDDGVVKYTSAHIDGVASELIVRSSHSTQAVPETIEEVRRLLYQHLNQP
ncbi:MAG: alpha/beta fold hydrolase [Deltaproteobacteria bacterium]|nr:alpha/beta fold hydrolase [Deltaproteobacteria bacterium]MBI3391372.1 alpha/beta fold hydrolase [Deltaproteobacteria bacterium]